MKSLKIFSVLMVLLALEFSTASEVEQLLRGADLTEKQFSKEQIENIARLMKLKVLKDQGIARKAILQIQETAKTGVILPGLTYTDGYDEILHKLKNKNQLFLITHLLNAKDFHKLASSNKEYFEKIGRNLDKLQSHLNRDFIDDFPIYSALPFPDNTLFVMEYFHMFCLHFGTEISYSPQYTDHLREIGVNIYKINESSSIMVSSFGSVGCWVFKLVNGELLMSLKSRVRSFSDFKFSDYITLCWEKEGHFYTFRNEKIKNLLSKSSVDSNKRICTPGCIESNDYKVCMCITPANFRKYLRKYSLLKV